MAEKINPGDLVRFSEDAGTLVNITSYGTHVRLSESAGTLVRYSKYTGQSISLSAESMANLPDFVKKELDNQD